jgi:hypothetical protein
MSAVRGNSLTKDFGSHLEACPANGGIPNWPDIQNEQIPTSLQVSQNPNAVGSDSSSGGMFSGSEKSMDLDWWRIWIGLMGVLVVRMGLIAIVNDPIDICLT